MANPDTQLYWYHWQQSCRDNENGIADNKKFQEEGKLVENNKIITQDIKLSEETIFIEIINKKGRNIIVGCIYNHPKLAVDEFNNQFLSPMLEKFSFENKII